MKKLRDLRTLPAWNNLEYWILRGFAGIVNFLPIKVSTWIARRTGDVIYWALPGRKRVALSNLYIAFGDTIPEREKHRLARETLRNLITSLMEFFRTQSMLKEAPARFEFEGTEHLDTAFAKGNGVVFAISHIGSWEYLAFLPFLRGYPCSVVVRPTKNPYIYNWIQDLRSATKLKPIDKNNSAKAILKLLKNNELVAILMDQWAGHDGLWINFFGKPTSTTSIPARLASHTGAAVIPGYCLRTAPGKYKIVIRPAVEIDETDRDQYEEKVTIKLNELLEGEIKKHPEQWSWAHKRWKKIERHLTERKKKLNAKTHQTKKQAGPSQDRSSSEAPLKREIFVQI